MRKLRPGSDVGGHALEAEDEFGVGEDGLDGGADAGFEVALIAAGLIEIQQLFEIVGGDRAAIRLARQRAR